MRINKTYFEASFVSFLIHALILLYLLGFFYSESKQTSILTKPINVSLIYKDQSGVKKNKPIKKIIEPQKIELSEAINKNETSTESISFDLLLNTIGFDELLKEDNLISERIEQNEIDLYSSLIVKNIQEAWRKPINIQDGLICNLRLTINKNGRVLNVNLIKSSGNIRFDNSAIKAVQRVETFSFYNQISASLFASNFRTVILKFNPS